MRISKTDLEAYRQTLIDLGNEASEYVRDAIQSSGARGVTAMRTITIDALTESIGIHGDAAQALAGQLFDEICAAEGINAASSLYTDIIDMDMLAGKVRWLCRKLVEGDNAGYVKRVGVLADFYTKRCNYMAQMRNCHGANMRYARIPTGTETCDWCLMLASRGFVYYTSADAEAGNHLHCVVGDTKVSAFDLLGAERRHYQGPLVHIVTASGNDLTITPNHPILTTNGWVAAGEVSDSDYLICACFDHRGVGCAPDEHHVHPKIEDVFSSLCLLNPSGLNRMPTTAEDFHGDGTIDGEVNVVWANSSLKDIFDASIIEPLNHAGFAGASLDKPMKSSRLLGSGMSDLLVERDDTTTDGIMSSFSLSRALGASHLGNPDSRSGAVAPTFDTSFIEPSDQCGTGDAVTLGKCQQTLASFVSGQEVIGHRDSSRTGSPNLRDIHADSLEVLAKSVTVASEFASDGVYGFPIPIEISRVVHKIVSVGDCHVYNLTTSTSWYYANNIITHNCDCICVPGRGGDTFNDATQVEGYDPDEYYRLWRESGFMPPKMNPTMARMVYNHDVGSASGYRNAQRSASRRLRRNSPARSLRPHDRELYFERLNDASTLSDLEGEYRDIIEDLIRRGDTVTDADWEDVANHYAYLLETRGKRRARKR